MARVRLSGSIDNADRVKATWSAVQVDPLLYECHFTAPSLSQLTVHFELRRLEDESILELASRAIAEGVRLHRARFRS